MTGGSGVTTGEPTERPGEENGGVNDTVTLMLVWPAGSKDEACQRSEGHDLIDMGGSHECRAVTNESADNAKVDFQAGVVRITASEYETAVAVAARRASKTGGHR